MHCIVAFSVRYMIQHTYHDDTLNVRILQYQTAGFTWEHCAPQLVKRHVRRLLWLCIVSSIFLDNSKISLYESISMSIFPYVISLTSSILPHKMPMHINWNISKTTWQKQSFLSLLKIHDFHFLAPWRIPYQQKRQSFKKVQVYFIKHSIFLDHMIIFIIYIAPHSVLLLNCDKISREVK